MARARQCILKGHKCFKNHFRGCSDSSSRKTIKCSKTI